MKTNSRVFIKGRFGGWVETSLEEACKPEGPYDEPIEVTLNQAFGRLVAKLIERGCLTVEDAAEIANNPIREERPDYGN